MGAYEQLQANEMESITSLYKIKLLAAISGALGIKLCVALAQACSNSGTTHCVLREGITVQVIYGTWLKNMRRARKKAIVFVDQKSDSENQPLGTYLALQNTGYKPTGHEYALMATLYGPVVLAYSSAATGPQNFPFFLLVAGHYKTTQYPSTPPNVIHKSAYRDGLVP
jgi:hypothetical protein